MDHYLKKCGCSISRMNFHIDMTWNLGLFQHRFELNSKKEWIENFYHQRTYGRIKTSHQCTYSLNKSAKDSVYFKCLKVVKLITFIIFQRSICNSDKCCIICQHFGWNMILIHYSESATTFLRRKSSKKSVSKLYFSSSWLFFFSNLQKDSLLAQ